MPRTYERVYDFVNPVNVHLDLGWMSRDLTRPKDDCTIKLAFFAALNTLKEATLPEAEAEQVSINPFPYRKNYVLPDSISMDTPSLRITIDGVVRTGITHCKGNHPAAVAHAPERKHLEENLLRVVKESLLDDPLIQKTFMYIELKDVYNSKNNELVAKVCMHLFLLRLKREMPIMTEENFKNKIERLMNNRVRKSAIDHIKDRTRQKPLSLLPAKLIHKVIVLEKNIFNRMKEMNLTSPIFPRCTFQRAADAFNMTTGEWLYQANWYHCIFVFGGVYKGGEMVPWNEKYRDTRSPEYKDIETDITVMLSDALRCEELLKKTWQNCELMDLYPGEENDLKFQIRVGLKDDELVLENIDIATEGYTRMIRDWLLKRCVEIHTVDGK